MLRNFLITALIFVLGSSMLFAQSQQSNGAGEKSLERLGNEAQAAGDEAFTGKNYTEAIKLYNEAVKKYKDAEATDKIVKGKEIGGVYKKLFKANFFGKNYQGAADALGHLVALPMADRPEKAQGENIDYSDSWDLVKLQAQIYEKNLKSQDKAIAVLTAFDTATPNYEAEKKIASLYLGQKKMQEALTWYKKAYALKQDADVIQNIAAIYVKLNDNANAVKAYDEFLTTNPPKEQLVKTYKNMGSLYEDLKQKNKAAENYEKSLELNYDNQLAVKLMVLYSDLNNLPKSKEKAELILSKNANDSNAIWYLGEIKYKQGDKPGAKVEFQKLVNDPQYKDPAQKYIASIDSEK